MSIAGLSSSSLAKLLRAPHSLAWTELWCLENVDADSAAALGTLPGLLTLDMPWNCRDVSFLPALSQLQTLHLLLSDDPWAVTGDAVVEAISSCVRLTSVALMAPVTSKHLSALLPRLPLLHTLSLGWCSASLESLRFLSDAPSLQRTLRSFVLKGQRAMCASEVRHVLGLKNLAKLELEDSFSEPLDGLTRHMLKPPSALLPKLTEFEYTPVAAVP